MVVGNIQISMGNTHQKTFHFEYSGALGKRKYLWSKDCNNLIIRGKGRQDPRKPFNPWETHNLNYVQ